VWNNYNKSGRGIWFGLVVVICPQVAVVFAMSGSEGLLGFGNTGAHAAGFFSDSLLVNNF
jgi:hypothetical protein